MKQIFHATEQHLVDAFFTDKQRKEHIDPKPWMEATSSFSYTSREMFVFGRTTHIKGQHLQWQNGRLSSEEFEATIADRIFTDAQRANRPNVQDPVGAAISSLASLFILFLKAKNR